MENIIHVQIPLLESDINALKQRMKAETVKDAVTRAVHHCLHCSHVKVEA